MFVRVHTAALTGIEAVDVTTEVRNIPGERTGEATTLVDGGLMRVSGVDRTVDL